MERQLDSNTYRRILEFVKVNGVEPFINLIEQISDLKNISSYELLDQRIFKKRDSISKVLRDNSLVVNFLKEFKNGFLNGDTSIYSDNFRDSIEKVSECLERGSIDFAIENARKLEELKIDVVNFSSDSNFFPRSIYIFTEKGDKKVVRIKDDNGDDAYFLDSRITDIIKPFSDGKISFNDLNYDSYILGDGSIENPYYFNINCERYKAYFRQNNWRICAENHADGTQYRYVYLPNLDTNLSNLPTESELASYEMPKELEEARKNAILTKRLPF